MELVKKSFQKYPIPNNFENQLGMDYIVYGLHCVIVEAGMQTPSLLVKDWSGRFLFGRGAHDSPTYHLTRALYNAGQGEE